MDLDAQLVARAQSGDQQAFAELVRRHSARVFRLAVSILGREFVPEAEDVAQEVFLKAHHAIQSFRGEAEFGSWIYRITFNQAVNRKARVRFRSRDLASFGQRPAAHYEANLERVQAIQAELVERFDAWQRA